jgi:hypothetical protein
LKPIQELIEKQLFHVIELQKATFSQAEAADRMAALAAAIAGLRDLDAIFRRQQPKAPISQEVKSYIADRAPLESRAAQLLKQIVESELEREGQ